MMARDRITTLRNVIFFLIPFALASSGALAAPTHPWRIMADAPSIDGGFWLPLVTTDKGDPIATECAIRLGRQLTLGDSRVYFHGIPDTIDALVPQEPPERVSATIARVLQASGFLRALVAPGSVPGSSSVRLWVAAVKQDPSAKRAKRVSHLPDPVEVAAKDEAAISPAFAAAVVELLSRLGVTPDAAAKQTILAEFEPYPFDYHLALAKSRIYLSLGKKLGENVEPRFIRDSAASLDEARDIREKKGLEPSAFEWLDRLGLTFRRFNLSYGSDPEFRSTLAEAMKATGRTGKAFPQFLLVRGTDDLLRSRAEADAAKSAALLAEAKSTIDEAIASANHNFAEAYFTRGTMQSGAAERIQDYRTAVELNPALLRAQVYLAAALASDEATWSESQAIFERLPQEYPLGLYEHARVLWERNNPAAQRHTLAEARKLVDQLLSATDQGFYLEDAHLLRGLILAEQGQWPKVEEDLLASLDSVQAWKQFAAAYRRASNAAPAETDGRFRSIEPTLAMGNRSLAPGSAVLHDALLGLSLARFGDRSAAAGVAAGVSSSLDGGASNPLESRAYLAFALTQWRLGFQKLADAMLQSEDVRQNVKLNPKR